MLRTTQDCAIAFLSSVNPIILERGGGLEGEILGDVISRRRFELPGMSVYEVLPSSR